MISRRELDTLGGQWSLDIGVIEKDYVLGWLLAGIAQHPELATTWVFKGGTCLRKCYYETFRFSEDLDFTVIDGGPEEPNGLQRVFAEIAEWLREEAGIELILDARAFRRRQNRRGHPTTQGRIAYRGPNETRGVPPKVKFDITSDEVLTQNPTLRPIGHQYSDRPLPGRGVASYPITELFGEKPRALAERCRPRDLYDVVHLHRHPDLVGRASAVAAVLSAHTLESMCRRWNPCWPRGFDRRSRPNGTTCSAINSHDHCRRSRTSGPLLRRCSAGSTARALRCAGLALVGVDREKSTAVRRLGSASGTCEFPQRELSGATRE